MLGMGLHNFNPSSSKAKAGGLHWKTSLGYTVKTFLKEETNTERKNRQTKKHKTKMKLTKTTRCFFTGKHPCPQVIT